MVQLSTEYPPQELSRMIDVLLEALRAKDTYTFAHAQRVGRYAEQLARKMNLPQDKIQVIRILGTLHDIGKLFIPDHILLKTSDLTPAEWVVMQKHTGNAVRILACMGINHEYATAVRGIHEEFDGKGYPDRLKGEQIPLLARILSVADCYDAMVTDRPYRKAVSHKAACAEIRRERGKQFCPTVVDNFLELARQNGLYPRSSQ